MQEQETTKEEQTVERPKFDFAEHRAYLWTLTSKGCTEQEFSEALQNVISEFQRAHAWLMNKQLKIIMAQARQRFESQMTTKGQEKDSVLDLEEAKQ